MNHLSTQKSPYLLQHKNNPIWWHPWGERAFKWATEQNKPVFLSIGYSTCHWCHVMAGDSFLNIGVAKILNANFIAIKVDREERPDVDHNYMKFVQAMTQTGGWPLSVFLTPNKEPFWGATFIQREYFIQILQQIAYLWQQSDGDDIKKEAQKITAIIFKKQNFNSLKKSKIDDIILIEYYQGHLNTFDNKHGGFGSAPKFPAPITIMALFRYYRRFKAQKAFDMGIQTLENMCCGGLYDHLGGGFHRYTTDQSWLIPHFEKMLYDNALITMSLLEAWQLTKKPKFVEIITATLKYVINTMQDKNGGYYSAQDADSEQTEGKFYVWQDHELQSILTKQEYQLICTTYHVLPLGNFVVEKSTLAIEQRAGLKAATQSNILHVKTIDKLNYTNKTLWSARNKLLKVRAKRVFPHLDDKIITSWNGLMVATMAKAYQVLHDEQYLQSAIKAANFILKNLYKNNMLLRRYKDQDSSFNGYLEDYAYLIYGLIELYQASTNTFWLITAKKLQQTQNELFWDSDNKLYFDNDGQDKTIIFRTRELFDNVIPSGNSISAYNLLRLASYFIDERMINQAEQIISAALSSSNYHPYSHSFLMIAIDYYIDHNKEIVVSAPKSQKSQDFINKINESFIPNKIIAFITNDNQLNKKVPITDNKKVDKKTLIYICEQGLCKLPTTNTDKAFNLCNQFKVGNDSDSV